MHWGEDFDDVEDLIIWIWALEVKDFRYQQCEKMDYTFQYVELEDDRDVEDEVSNDSLSENEENKTFDDYLTEIESLIILD